MKKYIYADNAATTKMDQEAFEKMRIFYMEDFSNPSQPYSFSKKSKAAIKEARAIIANCINADPDEIYFTSGGTESDNWAIKGIGQTTEKKIIYISNIEHHAVINSCQSYQNNNAIVNFLPVNKKGIVSSKTLENRLKNDDKTQLSKSGIKLVSIMYANNEIGSVQPIKELSAVAHKYGAIFHTDAVQAVGHIPIDVKDCDVDLLSASAHKFNGPKGIGFLYIKRGINIQGIINGGSQESGMRAGTENVASIIGMAYALKNNCENLEANRKHLIRLENRLLKALKKGGIDFIRNGYKDHIPGNISISIKNKEGEMLLHRLDLLGICVSTGSACDSKNTQVSHVIKAIRVPDDYSKGTIRISLGKNNTTDEIDSIAAGIIEICTKRC